MLYIMNDDEENLDDLDALFPVECNECMDTGKVFNGEDFVDCEKCNKKDGNTNTDR